MKGQQCIGFSFKRSLVLFFLTLAAGGGRIHATSKPLTGEDRRSVRRRDELALAPVSGYHQGRNTSLAGEDRKSMRRQDSEIRWCQDLLKAGPGYFHSIRVGTDTRTGTHHWQGKTRSSSDIKTSRCGTRELQDSRLGLGTSTYIRDELAPGLGSQSLAGEDRKVHVTSRPRDLVAPGPGHLKSYSRPRSGYLKVHPKRARDTLKTWASRFIQDAVTQGPVYSSRRNGSSR